MKISDFWYLMDDEFGEQYAHVLAKTLCIPGSGGQTVQQALDSGTDVRRLWLEVCLIQEVPPERRLGRDKGLQKNSSA